MYIYFIVVSLSYASKDSNLKETSTQMNNVDSPCQWIDVDRKCSDSQIRFYLYTRSNIDDMQLMEIDEDWNDTNFNPHVASKILIHGFRSDMFLEPLYQMKTGLLVFHHFIPFFTRFLVYEDKQIFPRSFYNNSKNIFNELNTTFFLWIGLIYQMCQ